MALILYRPASGTVDTAAKTLNSSWALSTLLENVWYTFFFIIVDVFVVVQTFFRPVRSKNCIVTVCGLKEHVTKLALPWCLQGSTDLSDMRTVSVDRVKSLVRLEQAKLRSISVSVPHQVHALPLHRLVGLVVTAPASRAADPGFDSRWRRGDFSGSGHTSDLKIGTPVATLPGVIGATACTMIRADPSLRHTGMLLGR